MLVLSFLPPFNLCCLSLLSEAMPVVDEKCKQELQSIMKDDTLNKDERLERIYEVIGNGARQIVDNAQ